MSTHFSPDTLHPLSPGLSVALPGSYYYSSCPTGKMRSNKQCGRRACNQKSELIFRRGWVQTSLSASPLITVCCVLLAPNLCPAPLHTLPPIISPNCPVNRVLCLQAQETAAVTGVVPTGSEAFDEVLTRSKSRFLTSPRGWHRPAAQGCWQI